MGRPPGRGNGRHAGSYSKDHGRKHLAPENDGPPDSPHGPGGPRGPGNPRRGPPHSPTVVRNETWLRGGSHTDSAGLVELNMIYTGFYGGRAPHIHTMVHVNWSASENGTIVSHAGTVAHVGQFFFHEEWNDVVFGRWPYTLNTNRRTLNVDDGLFKHANADGNVAFVECVLR
jgi:hypothetical protein